MEALIGLVKSMFPGIDWRITLPLQLFFTVWGLYRLYKAIAGLETAYEAGPEKEKKQRRSVGYAITLILTPWVIAPLIYHLGLALSPEVPGASKGVVDFLKNSSTPTPVMQISPP